MRYREVVIDGQVFLEIVDDDSAPPQPPRDRDRDDDDDPEPETDRGKVWIGQLVPFL